MKTKLLLAAFIFGCLIACNKADDENPTIVDQTNPVRLSTLKIGQKSLYLRYYLKCDDVNDSFEWTRDTLVLEVVKDGDQLQLKESLTPLSPMYLDGAFPEPVYYAVNRIASGLLLPDRSSSALFFFYANDTLRLDPVHDVNLSQDNCTLMQDENPFIGNDIGMVNDFKFGPIHYSGLTAVSCEPFFNLDAYLLYDNDALKLSHVLTFDTISNVYGWQLLEH